MWLKIRLRRDNSSSSFCLNLLLKIWLISYFTEIIYFSLLQYKCDKLLNNGTSFILRRFLKFFIEIISFYSYNTSSTTRNLDLLCLKDLTQFSLNFFNNFFFNADFKNTYFFGRNFVENLFNKKYGSSVEFGPNKLLGPNSTLG